MKKLKRILVWCVILDAVWLLFLLLAHWITGKSFSQVSLVSLWWALGVTTALLVFNLYAALSLRKLVDPHGKHHNDQVK